MEQSNLVNPNCKLFLFKSKASERQTDNTGTLTSYHFTQWSVQPGVKNEAWINQVQKHIMLKSYKHQFELLHEQTALERAGNKE